MFKNNLAYEASAGSGKTFMLVVRYLSLLFMGAQPNKILALTFTNKAAREMSERVVETLEELEHRGELVEIAKVCEMDIRELIKKRDAILEEFLNANSKIMTIDSFFTQILRKFSLYGSLMPDFSTFNAQHEQKLLERFLKEVSVAGKKDMLISLALSSSKRVSDIFKLLEDFYVKKEEFAHLQFEYVEIKNIQERAMLALKGLQNLVNSCEFASNSLKNAVDIEDFELLKEKSWVVKESLEYWVFKKCFTLEMNGYLHTIQTALVEYHQAKEKNFFYALKELLGLYIKAKKALYVESSELSFSDVTALVYEILHRLDDSEFLYFRLDAKIEHILLDEFQDTSVVQYEILRPLIEEITSGEGVFNAGSFFFVGDVKQSIYRFRGGVSALFGEVQKQNSTEVEKLLTNYRSKKEVVEFVNRTFLEHIKGYTPQIVREDARGGYVAVVENEEILEETLIQVQNLIAMGANLDSIAILCATNGDGEAIKNMLISLKIEVVTETTTKLINQRSVKAILEYLKYLYFKENIYALNFFSLIEQPVEKIDSIDLNRVKLFDIIKITIERYKLFSNDFHLIRFLSVIGKYQDIEALLFEYERLDTSAAASDLSGVRVLTVHKSKGLEYEHVIVMDRLKKPPTSRGSIIYEYDGISLENIYLRTKQRKEIDKAYERALEKEELLVHEDTLNAFYVAFTRARDNLMIIKKPQKSTFDILSLEVSSFGVLHIEKNVKKEVCHYKSLKYKELYYGTQNDILALESEKDHNLDAINFGIALHYMLEMMPSFTTASIEHAKSMLTNKFGFSLLESEIEDIQRRVNLFVKSPQVQLLLEGTHYKEKALRYKNNLRYVDLLIEKEDGSFNVIDYKSSSAYSEHHVKQVHYYVEAIEAISNKKVEGYLCYLLKDRIEIVKV